jgi:hypothetical protein
MEESPMRRTLLAAAVATAVTLAGIATAPAASAVTEPTVAGTSVSPKKFLIQIGGGGSPLFTQTATFNDPDETINSVLWTVVFPGGSGQYGPYATSGGTRTGSTITFSRTYGATSANAPGRYTVRFKAVPKSGITYASSHIASASFVVNHRTRIVSTYQRTSGHKLRFSGWFYPHYAHAKGKKLILSVKQKGSKKFTKLDKTKVRKDATFRYPRHKLRKGPGKYRVAFKGDKYSMKSRTTSDYVVY